MLRAKTIVAFLAAIACAALLLSPGAASASGGPASRQIRPTIAQGLALRGTNGFQIEVTVKNRRRLTLAAQRSHNVIEGASYALRIHPRRGSDDIVAGLGRLGRIDVRFVPRKVKESKPPHDCHGGKFVTEIGHFVGLIVFRGERGYTRVRAHRAFGAISRTPALTCPNTAAKSRKHARHAREVLEHTAERMENGEEEGVQADVLTAFAPGQHVALVASRVSNPTKKGKKLSLANVVVVGSLRRGRIEERSEVFDLLDKGSIFRFRDRRLPSEEAVLAPPAPFSGSAAFRRHPAQPPSWGGDLKVDLPGFGPVRLTGHGVRASMCEGFSCFLRGGGAGQSLLRRLAS